MEEIEKTWKEDRRFKPGLDERGRERRWRRWHSAGSG